MNPKHLDKLCFTLNMRSVIHDQAIDNRVTYINSLKCLQCKIPEVDFLARVTSASDIVLLKESSKGKRMGKSSVHA